MFFLKMLLYIIALAFPANYVLANPSKVGVIDLSLLKDGKFYFKDQLLMGGLRGVKEINIDFVGGKVSSIRTTYDRGLPVSEIEKAIKSNYGGMITRETEEVSHSAWRISKHKIVIILMESKKGSYQVLFVPFRSVP